MEPIPTGFTDSTGMEIKTLCLVEAEDRKRYEVIDDSEFGFSIKDMRSGIIEQLTEEVAKTMRIIALIRAFPLV